MTVHYMHFCVISDKLVFICIFVSAVVRKLFQRIPIYRAQPCVPVFSFDSVTVSAASPPQVFISGSCDHTARLWDTRKKGAAPQTFHGHDGDVNAVSFMPKNSAYFGTASDDGSCRVFDTRTGHSLQLYTHPMGESVKVLAIAFSISGGLMFSSYDNGDCYVWDTVTAEVIGHHRPSLLIPERICSFAHCAPKRWERLLNNGLS